MVPNRSIILAVLSLVALSNAGPLGPLPNVTSSEIGLKEGSCSVGDVVYLAGDEFPGATPCERCACADGSVRCEQQRCEPRPGCKALHRPDHCCPTYQCECEQDGRVYGNGEKLVDPLDPCRVCYCQGGEVVCRRIACFVRDDCQPRLVKGRCCPEYDNCPLRAVTSVPGIIPSISTIEDIGSSAQPLPPKENIKQEITIKEITPVSEIPVISDVKVKEILPLPSIEVSEYPSSKSPLIPREAIPEKAVTNNAESTSKADEPVLIDLISPLPSHQTSDTTSQIKSTDSLPSKISLSTQDSINSDIYPSDIPIVIASLGVPPLTPDYALLASTTRPTIIEEEDTSLFDHNPAFPPLPDDLSVIGNHEDESISEQNIDTDHINNVHQIESIVNTASSLEVPTTHATSPQSSPTEAPPFEIPDMKEHKSSPEISKETTIKTDVSSIGKVFDDVAITSLPFTAITYEIPAGTKDSPMLNLRTAIPTIILNIPSLVPEDITGELDNGAESVTIIEEPEIINLSAATNPATKLENYSTPTSEFSLEGKNVPRSNIKTNTPFEITTQELSEVPDLLTTAKTVQDQITTSILKSNIPTEITSETELSSLPIETSDQNPHDSVENIQKDKLTSSKAPNSAETTTVKLMTEVITAPSVLPTKIDNQPSENEETTEFIPILFGSSESVTDVVKITENSQTETQKTSAIIETSNENKDNVLTDLINLVGDVASISDHTEAPDVARRATTSSSFSDSEELIPVNAGYKSKNSNYNLNSITEIPQKQKNQTPINKQKIIEIEDDESETITDAPPPYDKAEPMTRRPIIDNVSDTNAKNETDKKDIEIITKSYVPTINRRPTKVVMKKPLQETSGERLTPVAASEETGTESALSSNEMVTMFEEPANTTGEPDDTSVDTPNEFNSTAAV